MNWIFLWYGWPTEGVRSYFQPEPLSEILTIATLRQAESRIWTSVEPECRPNWMKIGITDNHSTMAPPHHYTTIPLHRYITAAISVSTIYVSKYLFQNKHILMLMSYILFSVLLNVSEDIESISFSLNKFKLDKLPTENWELKTENFNLHIFNELSTRSWNGFNYFSDCIFFSFSKELCSINIEYALQILIPFFIFFFMDICSRAT